MLSLFTRYIVSSVPTCGLLIGLGFSGLFQSKAGQFGCITCDSLGDFFQELPVQISCEKCAYNTQRYLGVLSAVNRSSCQCKEGDASTSCAALRHLYSRRPLLALAGHFNAKAEAGEVLARTMLCPVRLVCCTHGHGKTRA